MIGDGSVPMPLSLEPKSILEEQGMKDTELRNLISNASQLPFDENRYWMR
jgi:hypothetical protein